MQSHPLPLTEIHHPATFESRGAAAPFTTPLLAAARVRESKRAGIELVVPNPSGGRGVYVVQWPGARALCTPTVHDTMLFQRLSQLPRIDPASVRAAALEVALDGYAGRPAVGAAGTAMNSDRAQRLLTHFLLLTALIEQVEPTSDKGASLPERTPDLDRRASMVFHRIAPSLGRSAANLASGLAAMGDAFAPAGINRGDRTGRIPRLIARMDETRASLALWLDSDPANDIAGLGRTLTNAISASSDSGAAMLAHTRTTLADPVAMLKHWIAAPAEIHRLASRCDWLLDGWERVCLLWQAAGSDPSRRASLLEMAQLLPVLPPQVMEWTDSPIPPEAMDQTCRVISQDDTWRSGSAAFALTERNEAMRAMSV